MRRLAMIILVLVIAAILRFWQLTFVPPALDWDEVSNAYNGYSILVTGRDEFGQSFPILFRAYDGYVPPVLIYLNTLSTRIFGLNEFAARFPNALLGTLTVLGVYLLVAKIHSRSVPSTINVHSGSENKNRVALLAALFLAIAPWHIIYSRINVFATTPIFFVVFATYFFLLGLSRFKFLIVSLVFFILAIFSYFSAYIFVPLFAFALVLIFRKRLDLRKLRLVLLPILFASFLILFLIPGGQNRLRGISIFNDPDTVKIAAVEAKGEGLAGRIVHNRRFVYAQEILKGYFVNFRGDFLFGRGDAVERMVVGASGAGLLLIWFLPFLMIGIFHLIDQRPKGWTIWIFWLLLAPIAAATSLPQPASTRITLMIVPLVIITAYGFYNFARSRLILSKILILLLAANIYLFAHQYFVHFPVEKSDKWFWGYDELFDYLNTPENFSKKVHFVYGQPDPLDQIHMFLLFYNKIDPVKWQANGGTRLGCIGTTGQFRFERYDFIPYSCLTKPIDWENFGNDDLIVTSKLIDGSYINKVEYLDGKDAFYVYEYDSLQQQLENLIIDI